MLSTLIKNKELIKSINKYSNTILLTTRNTLPIVNNNNVLLFSTHKSSKSTSSPLLSNTKLNKQQQQQPQQQHNNNSNKTILDNVNNNKLKTHYYPNELIKSSKSSLILDILKSKRLTVFLLYWWIVSPGLEPLTITIGGSDSIDILYYTDLLSLPIFGISIYDLLIKSNFRNKFYELTILELMHYRDSIETIIKQPFQIPSINNCKFFNDQVLNIEPQSDSNNNTIKKKKLIKCTFDIQLDSSSHTATITTIGELPNKLFSLNSLLNLGKRVPLDEKYQFKELTINIEPENKNYIIYKDSL